MGGRGTFASGKSVKYTYETVDFIDGVKVLRPIDNRKSLSLPEEAHSSSAYVLLDRNNKFKMYREYDKDHFLVLEIAYHKDANLGSPGKPVMHYHKYTRDFKRSDGVKLESNHPLYNKYKRFFKGVE